MNRWPRKRGGKAGSGRLPREERVGEQTDGEGGEEVSWGSRTIVRQDRPGPQGLCVLSPPAARLIAPPPCSTGLSFPAMRACGRRPKQRRGAGGAGTWRTRGRARGGRGGGRGGGPGAQPGPAPGGGRPAARRPWAQRRREHAAPREPGWVSAAGAAGGCGGSVGRGRGRGGVPRGQARSCRGRGCSQSGAPSPARPGEAMRPGWVPDARPPVSFTKSYFGSPVIWIQADPFIEIPSKFANVL